VDYQVPLVPQSVTKAVIYLIRNPLDIVVSYSYHLNLPVDEVVKNLNDDNYSISPDVDSLKVQLEQKLFSWRKHVLSWINLSKLKIHIVKYEYLIQKPFDTFKKAISFIGMNLADNEIKKAISFSEFRILREQEINHGFIERSPSSTLFFRKGQIEQWKNALSKKQIDMVIRKNYFVMKKFGYISDLSDLPPKN